MTSGATIALPQPRPSTSQGVSPGGKTAISHIKVQNGDAWREVFSQLRMAQRATPDAGAETTQASVAAGTDSGAAVLDKGAAQGQSCMAAAVAKVFAGARTEAVEVSDSNKEQSPRPSQEAKAVIPKLKTTSAPASVDSFVRPRLPRTSVAEPAQKPEKQVIAAASGAIAAPVPAAEVAISASVSNPALSEDTRKVFLAQPVSTTPMTPVQHVVSQQGSVKPEALQPVPPPATDAAGAEKAGDSVSLADAAAAAPNALPPHAEVSIADGKIAQTAAGSTPPIQASGEALSIHTNPERMQPGDGATDTALAAATDSRNRDLNLPAASAKPTRAQHESKNNASIAAAVPASVATPSHLQISSIDTAAPRIEPDSLQRDSSGAPARTSDTFLVLDRGDSSPATTWIHAGAQRAEAGYLDPSLGWVSVRAETHGSSVQASLVPGSTHAAAELAPQLPALNAHLAHQGAQASVTMASTDNSSNAGQQGSARDDRAASREATAPAKDRGASIQVSSASAVPVASLPEGNLVSIFA